MWTTLVIALLTLTTCFTGGAHGRCLQDPDQGRLNEWIKSGKGPLVIDYYEWDSGNVLNHVMKILAEEVLSYPVTYAPYDSENVYNWTGLISGNIHVSFDVWVTTDQRKQYIKDFALSSNRTIESAGANGQNVQSGWFIPEWVVNAYPALASYRGLRDPAIAKVLALNESEWIPSNTTALILTVVPFYAEDPDPKIVKNLDLNAIVQYAGGDDRSTTSIWREMTLAGLPLIYSLWSPHQFLAEYVYRNDSRFKMIRLNLPTYDPRNCGTGENLVRNDRRINTAFNTHQNCDYESTFPQKILSSSLQTFSDELYWLAKQLSLSNDDLNIMLGEISYKNASLDQAACTWLKSNVRRCGLKLIKFEACNGGCGDKGFCTFNKCVCVEGWEGSNCETKRIYHFVEWNSPVAIALLVVTCIMLVTVMALLVMLILNQNTEVVKAQGFVFNVLIWFPCFSFVLIIASLLVRNYRIVTIFSAKRKLENVRDGKLMLFLLPLLLTEIALLSMLSTIGQPKVANIQDGGSGKWIRSCQFENTKALVPALIAYKVLLVIGAVILAYKTKDIPDRFGESKSIALAIYNMSVVSASFMVVLFIVKVDEIIWFVIYSLTVILVSGVFESIFFGRIVYFIWSKETSWKDDQSGGSSGIANKGSTSCDTGVANRSTRKNAHTLSTSNAASSRRLFESPKALDAQLNSRRRDRDQAPHLLIDNKNEKAQCYKFKGSYPCTTLKTRQCEWGYDAAQFANSATADAALSIRSGDSAASGNDAIEFNSPGKKNYFESQQIMPAPGQTYYQLIIEEGGIVLLRDWPRARLSQKWTRNGTINPGVSRMEVSEFLDGEMKERIIWIFGEKVYDEAINAAIRCVQEESEKMRARSGASGSNR
ncbi:hypothetical protein HDU67_005359 [Dinochytrium kinnereticum]|nr:hypothetical protein HDU67_005359 [Dinochytrium kinnereticum]